jgi:hypothetical protein
MQYANVGKRPGFGQILRVLFWLRRGPILPVYQSKFGFLEAKCVGERKHETVLIQ